MSMSRKLDWQKAQWDSTLARGVSFSTAGEIGARDAAYDVAWLEARAEAKLEAAAALKREKAVKKKSSKTHGVRLAKWKSSRG